MPVGAQSGNFAWHSPTLVHSEPPSLPFFLAFSLPLPFMPMVPAPTTTATTTTAVSLSYPGTAINQRVQSSSSVVYTKLPVVITTISVCSCWRWWWCVCCIYARALYDSVRLENGLSASIAQAAAAAAARGEHPTASTQ